MGLRVGASRWTQGEDKPPDLKGGLCSPEAGGQAPAGWSVMAMGEGVLR